MSAAADVAEDASVDAVYVWRWVQMNSLWNTHPNADMRSEKAFFSKFGNGNIVRAMLVIGSSVQYTKDTHHDWIEKHWGGDWYDHVHLLNTTGGVNERPFQTDHNADYDHLC